MTQVETVTVANLIARVPIVVFASLRYASWRRVIVERKTISIMKACEVVGVSRRTIYNWLSSGKIEYVRTAGGSVRIFVDTLWRSPNDGDRLPAPVDWQAEGRNPV